MRLHSLVLDSWYIALLRTENTDLQGTKRNAYAA